MAWRIDDRVIRGELDNRVKGRVTGLLWLDGVAAPVDLDLVGNTCADLAGCLLSFTRKAGCAASTGSGHLNPRQRGSVGDITASRKVRVLDAPIDEVWSGTAGRPPPRHMANALYVEWYSETNGRVVLESTDFEVVVSAPSWKPDPGDEKEHIEHPLVRRVMDGALAFRERLRWMKVPDDQDLRALSDAYVILGPKLGGALTSLAEGEGFDPPMVVALLKRAMRYVHDAQAALVRLDRRDALLPPVEREALRNELLSIREAMLEIMKRMRDQA